MEAAWRKLEYLWQPAECTTMKDVAELLAIDAVTKLMPRPIANHVRNHSPATLTDATKLADSFI